MYVYIYIEVLFPVMKRLKVPYMLSMAIINLHLWCMFQALGSPTIDLGEIQETSTEIFKGSGSGYTEVW